MTQLQLETELMQLTRSCHLSGWTEQDRDRYDQLYSKLQALKAQQA